MEIMEDKPWYTEEVVKIVKNVEKRYCEKKFVEGAHTGVLIAKNNLSLKKGPKEPFFKIFYLASSYFLRGQPPKYRRR